MANEISYPFTSNSAGGGSQMMDQAQWQRMSRIFGKDRVDYQLNGASVLATDLPFYAQVVNGTSVSVAPGRAQVGGFAYQLTATKTVTIEANTGSLPRIDLIVLRADLSAGSVNVAVVKGQAAASAKVPVLTQVYGGKWEMPLHQVNVPANSGALTLANVMAFDTPNSVAVPWNATATAALEPVGTFVYDMDSNTNDTQSEYFVSRDAIAISRDLANPRKYTPTLINTSTALPSANCTGRWRWIAPGVIYFSATLVNDWEDRGPVSTGGSALGITLPKPACGAQGQILHGMLRNPGYNGGLPNLMDLSCMTNRSSIGQTVAYIFFPNPSNTAEGLDSLRSLPPQSTIYISGVYETDTFGN